MAVKGTGYAVIRGPAHFMACQRRQPQPACGQADQFPCRKGRDVRGVDAVEDPPLQFSADAWRQKTEEATAAAPCDRRAKERQHARTLERESIRPHVLIAGG